MKGPAHLPNTTRMHAALRSRSARSIAWSERSPWRLIRKWERGPGGGGGGGGGGGVRPRAQAVAHRDVGHVGDVAVRVLLGHEGQLGAAGGAQRLDDEVELLQVVLAGEQGPPFEQLRQDAPHRPAPGPRMLYELFQ